MTPLREEILDAMEPGEGHTYPDLLIALRAIGLEVDGQEVVAELRSMRSAGLVTGGLHSGKRPAIWRLSDPVIAARLRGGETVDVGYLAYGELIQYVHRGETRQAPYAYTDNTGQMFVSRMGGMVDWIDRDAIVAVVGREVAA